MTKPTPPASPDAIDRSGVYLAITAIIQAICVVGLLADGIKAFLAKNPRLFARQPEKTN
jgi:hypothetical protein